MTQNEIALKILNMGKDGYKDDAEGFEKLNKANKLIEEHVAEQLRLYGVSVSLQNTVFMSKLQELINDSFAVVFNANDFFCVASSYPFYVDSEDISWILPIYERYGIDGLNACMSHIQKQDPLKPYMNDKFLLARKEIEETNPNVSTEV